MDSESDWIQGVIVLRTEIYLVKRISLTVRLRGCDIQEFGLTAKVMERSRGVLLGGRCGTCSDGRPAVLELMKHKLRLRRNH